MSAPLTEIEVEGVGTIRHLNMWQIGAMADDFRRAIQQAVRS